MDLLLLPGQLKAESLRSAAGHFLFDFYGVMFALELDGNGHACTEKVRYVEILTLIWSLNQTCD